MQPENPASVIFDFAVECAPLAPVAKRIRLYRALAKVIGDEKRAAEFNLFASEFESLEARCKQLRLPFGDDQNGDGQKA